MPSQRTPVPDPYYPQGPTDLIATPGPGGRDNIASNLSVVRSVYDSRPPYAYDFTFTDRSTNLGGDFVFGGFLTPLGYITVLRKVGLTLYGNKAVGGDGFIGPYGFISNQLIDPELSLLINGGQQLQWLVPLSPNSPNQNPVAGFVGNFAGQAYTSGIEIDTFVPLPENTTVTIAVPGFTDTIGMFFNVTYSGNLILTDGRIAQLQIGNNDPEPVTVSNP